jgi:hypothetical protein
VTDPVAQIGYDAADLIQFEGHARGIGAAAGGAGLCAWQAIMRADTNSGGTGQLSCRFHDVLRTRVGYVTAWNDSTSTEDVIDELRRTAKIIDDAATIARDHLGAG